MVRIVLTFWESSERVRQAIKALYLASRALKLWFAPVTTVRVLDKYLDENAKYVQGVE